MSGATGPGSAEVERAAAVLGLVARRDWPVGPLTTYRVGGSAALFVEAGDESDLVLVSEAVQASGLPVLVLGRGSNLLVADRGFAGIVVHLGGAFATLEVDGLGVRAGGATSLPVLARRSAAAGLTGLEWAVGVPGSVGGAVRMNAGGHGSDTAAVLSRCWVFDLASGHRVVHDPGSLELGYRHSALQAEEVVTRAEFRLARGDQRTSEAEIAEIVRWRRENQPGGQNAGSVFTNPPGDSSGRLVEVAGLRGHRLGSAAVSTKHANFIQADPGGSADDVVALVAEVRQLVGERTGVWLQPEVRMVGESRDPGASSSENRELRSRPWSAG